METVNTQMILMYLERLSNELTLIGLLGHLAAAAALVAVFSGIFKKRTQIFNLAVNLLLLSVFVIAVINGNPFHAVTFGVMVLVSLTEIFSPKNDAVPAQKGILLYLTLAFLAAGLWYPEFVRTNAFLSLFISPVGVIPCPTLITVLALLNLIYPKANKLQFATLTVFGILYGLIGTFKFKVYYDVILLLLAFFSAYRSVALLRRKA